MWNASVKSLTKKGAFLLMSSRRPPQNLKTETQEMCCFPTKWPQSKTKPTVWIYVYSICMQPHINFNIWCILVRKSYPVNHKHGDFKDNIMLTNYFLFLFALWNLSGRTFFFLLLVHCSYSITWKQFAHFICTSFHRLLSLVISSAMTININLNCLFLFIPSRDQDKQNCYVACKPPALSGHPATAGC